MMAPERQEEDIILVCNPKAGGRWRELAGILDSAEAMHVRRIVTDEIDDIRSSLRRLGTSAKLVCIYGGDGTILKSLNYILPTDNEEPLTLAFVSGGTMNVSARWCGWTEKPRANFKRVVNQYLEDRLIIREVPLLEVKQGDTSTLGFTFGMGPSIRVLDEYERSSKGKAAALMFALRAVIAAYVPAEDDIRRLTEAMAAEISLNGTTLPFDRWTFVFANTTGQILSYIRPFPGERRRETFFALAYAAGRRESLLLSPFLSRGWIPIDPSTLLKPISEWKRIGLAYLGNDSLPLDPRYINELATTFEIKSDEALYTIDGDIFQSKGEPISVSLGPTVRLVIGPDSPFQRPD
jgi:diacylglycerol kinase family enzyme